MHAHTQTHTHTHTLQHNTHTTAQHTHTHTLQHNTHTHTHTYVYLWFATVVICGQVPGVLCAEGQQISPGQHPPDRQGTGGIQVQRCQKMEHSSRCQRVSYHHEYLKRVIEGGSRPKTASHSFAVCDDDVSACRTLCSSEGKSEQSCLQHNGVTVYENAYFNSVKTAKMRAR